MIEPVAKPNVYILLGIGPTGGVESALGPYKTHAAASLAASDIDAEFRSRWPEYPRDERRLVVFPLVEMA